MNASPPPLVEPLLLLLVALGGCSAPPPAPAPPRAVRVMTVALRPVAQSARYSGVLEAKAQFDLAFRVPGRIARVGEVTLPGSPPRPLQEGDAVRAGDVLAVLDLDDLKSQVSAAAASAASTAAQVRTARAAQAQAEREAARARKLLADGDLAQAEEDRAETGLATATASLASIEAQHQARVDQLALTRSALTDATLRSPSDGLIARRAVDPGELVPPNVPVFSVVDVSELRVVLGVPDTRVGLLRLGQSVSVVLEAFPGHTLQSTVSKVAPTADPALRTYAVELRLAGSPELRPGMTATALVGDDAHQDAPVVPLSAVVRRADGPGYALFAVEDDARVAQVPIEISDLLENDVIVASGVDTGRRVVVEGAQFLRSGDRVEVVP